MFCPKCGIQNPDTGRFCRSCGTDLGNVSSALAETGLPARELTDKRGRRVTIEGAISKLFLGSAFLIVAIILGFSGNARGWWFWMLIPAFSILGAGVAQYIALKRSSGSTVIAPRDALITPLHSADQSALPPAQTTFVEPDSRYKTGDLVPASVTDNTTKQLGVNKEGETMTLPKV